MQSSWTFQGNFSDQNWLKSPREPEERMSPAMSVHLAITMSIDALSDRPGIICSNMFIFHLDLKKKLYGSILLAGGSALFENFTQYLEDRVFEQLPPEQEEIETVEVLANRK